MIKTYNDETMALLKRALAEQIPFSDCDIESFQALSKDGLVKNIMIKGTGGFTISDEGRTYLKSYEVETANKEETLRLARQANRRAFWANVIALIAILVSLCSLAIAWWRPPY